MSQLAASNVNSDSIDKLEGINQYLTFFLNAEEFALSLGKVKEILEYIEPTPVPRMPPFVHGAINLRGKIVPVIDLKKRLIEETIEISNRTCIVITEIRYNDVVMDVGLLIDAVSKVINIYPENIEVAPTFGGQIDTDFIRGMGKIESDSSDFIVILNIDNVLSMSDIQLLNKTTGSDSIEIESQE